MPGEVWISIKGFEGLYEVSSLGRVRSCDTIQHRSNGRVECDFRIKGKILKNRYTGRDAAEGRGYATVLLSGKNYKVHRLVAEAFIENAHEYEQVNHIDGNKKNNCVENLEWCAGSQNIQHSLKYGLRKTGESVENHKLTIGQVEEIRIRYVKGSPVNGAKPLAREFGVAAITITNIVRNKKWRWD